jgi:predicted metalloprotease
MPFEEKSRLDPSQVQDRRGRRAGTRVAVGGGLGIVILLVSLALGVDPAVLGELIEQAPAGSVEEQGSPSDLASECQTGEDANTRQDCRIVGFVNSIQAFWADEFAQQGGQYVEADTVLFTGAVQAACGYATSAVGPFYCPADRQVYLDLGFFSQLETRFGAQGGPFAEAYVLAHEYGHHVQNLLGVLSGAGSGATGPGSEAVQIELQADCLAGVWAHNATETGYLEPITEAEIAQSLDAAAAVGDDSIQQQTQGYVSPESWTHGSSAQRQQALMAGFTTGDVDACGNP